MQQLDFIIKKTLDEDGDLNVAQVKKQLDEIKSDLKIQSASEKSYYQAYFDELNQLINHSKNTVNQQGFQLD